MKGRLVSRAFFHHHLNKLLSNIGTGLSNKKQRKIRKKIGKKLLTLAKPRVSSKGKYDLEKDIRNASHNIKRLSQFKKGGLPSRDVSTKRFKGVSFNPKGTAGPAKEYMKDFMVKYDSMRHKNLPIQTKTARNLKELGEKDELQRWEDTPIPDEHEKANIEKYKKLEDMSKHLQPSVDIRKHRVAERNTNNILERNKGAENHLKQELERRKKEMDEAKSKVESNRKKYSAWGNVGQGLINKHLKLSKRADNLEENTKYHKRAQNRIKRNTKFLHEHGLIGNAFVNADNILTSNHKNKNEEYLNALQNVDEHNKKMSNYKELSAHSQNARQRIHDFTNKRQKKEAEAAKMLGEEKIINNIFDSDRDPNTSIITLEREVKHIPNDRLTKTPQDIIVFHPSLLDKNNSENELNFVSTPKENIPGEYQSTLSDILGNNVGALSSGEKIKTSIKKVDPQVRHAVSDHIAYGEQPTADILRKALHTIYSKWKEEE